LFNPAELRGEKAGDWYLNMISRLIMFIASLAVIPMLHSDADQRDNAWALIFDDSLVLPPAGESGFDKDTSIPNRGLSDSYSPDPDK
jgi:hypothetical protein